MYLILGTYSNIAWICQIMIDRQELWTVQSICVFLKMNRFALADFSGIKFFSIRCIFLRYHLMIFVCYIIILHSRWALCIGSVPVDTLIWCSLMFVAHWREDGNPIFPLKEYRLLQELQGIICCMVVILKLGSCHLVCLIIKIQLLGRDTFNKTFCFLPDWLWISP